MSDAITSIAEMLKGIFHDMEFSVSEDLSKISIPPRSEGFGPVEIEDYLDDEVIVFVGTRSHFHQNVSNVSEAKEEIRRFLTSLFNDEIIVWAAKGSGGHCAIEDKPRNRTLLGRKRNFLGLVGQAYNMQLKSLPSVVRTKHLRSKCESHFDPRRLRRLTGCYVP